MTDALFSVPVQGRETDERYTPRWVFDGLALTFDLDPASPVGGGDCVPARRKLTRHDDGLAHDWHGLVWLNPPFSAATPWADKFRAHGNGVFLGPVANARWWIDLAATADLMWLCRDFAFDHPEHAGRRSSMPLAFIAYGWYAGSGLSNLALSGRHDGVLVRGCNNGSKTPTICHACNGHGVVTLEGMEGWCPECDGSGRGGSGA